MTINDFFSYSNDDGSVRMYQELKNENNTNKIYLLNSYGKKNSTAYHQRRTKYSQ